MSRGEFHAAMRAVRDGERIVVREHGSASVEVYRNRQGRLVAEERHADDYTHGMAARFRLREILSSPFTEWSVDGSRGRRVAADGSGRGGSA